MSEINCTREEQDRTHDFRDIAACVHCDLDFAAFTYGGIRVDRMSTFRNREAIAIEQRVRDNAGRREDRDEARRWLSILVPALDRKQQSPRQFAAMFPEWEDAHINQSGAFKHISAGYMFKPSEPKPMEIKRGDIGEALARDKKLRAGSSLWHIPTPDKETATQVEDRTEKERRLQREAAAKDSKLYGVKAVDYPKWKDTHNTKFNGEGHTSFGQPAYDLGGIDYSTLEMYAFAMSGAQQAELFKRFELAYNIPPMKFTLDELRRPGETDDQVRARFKDLGRTRKLEVGMNIFLDSEGFPREAAACEEPFGQVVQVDPGEIIVRTGGHARGLGNPMWMKLRTREAQLAVPLLPPKCKFKGCTEYAMSVKPSAAFSLWCMRHTIEKAKLEGGPGIAPKHRYVTTPGELRSVVTCDLGADWED